MNWNWKAKLTSRKFWIAVAAFVALLIAYFGGDQGQADKITALIMAGATVIAYIIGEGLTDCANAQPPLPAKTETSGQGKYRKKPVEIDAFCYDGDLIGANGEYCVPDWAANAHKTGVLFFDDSDLYVKTLEGNMKVDVGDYIIKGVKGELYPCKPDIFKQTYDEV